MSKKQKAAALLAAALVGQALLGKYAKQQGATLGLSVAVVSVLGLAVGQALA